MPTFPVTRLAHVPIVARDGIVLSAAVYLPDAPGDGPFPAVIDAVPYRKDDDFLWSDWDTYGFMASRGVASVRLDLRGTGSSEGVIEDEYTAQELDDCEHAIAAVAAMEWCNGRVGMTGVSWGGFNSAQVAMRRPPALGAIAPIHWSANRYATDVHYVGGSLSVLDAVDWPGEMVVENALPPHPGIVGSEAFERMWHERLERTPQWPLNWPRRQRRDAYWKHGSLCEDWNALNCPVLAIGGWHDGYRDACLELLAHATVPRRAVIGPWGHTRPNRGWPDPKVDHRVLMARWFLRWLADERNGVEEEPMLIAYLMEGMPDRPYPADAVAGRWRAWWRWPSQGTGETRLELGDRRLLGGEPQTGPCRWDGPQSVGIGMPWWCGGSIPGGFSADMRPDDAGSLTWTTPPLEAELTVLGRARLRLRVSADREVALTAARLEHVRPDGRSALIARGSLNLTRRHSMEHPEPLVPGEMEEVEVALMAAGITIPPGHRLRLAVAGADFPITWPSPARAVLTVHGGTLYLPVPDETEEVEAPELPAPQEGPPNPVRPLEGLPPSWTIEREHVSGVVRTVSSHGWETHLPEGGFSAGSARVTGEIADGDPLSCRVISDNTATARHDGITAHARSRLQVSCTEASFVTEIDLRVERDGELFFERHWRDEVPRDLM